MKKIAILALLISSPAFADNAPTVTLTQDELQSIIRTEIMKAMANSEAEKAKSTYAKVNSAFAPAKPVPTPEVTPGK